MFPYGKMTQTAIAVVSRLAELYDGGTTRLSSGDIAQKRRLSKPLVAKILTVLAQAGIVAGIPGPGGGYTLARPPAQVTLFDLVKVFERYQEGVLCPFGPNWCGRMDPCPLHSTIIGMRERIFADLVAVDFSSFAARRTSASDEASPAREAGPRRQSASASGTSKKAPRAKAASAKTVRARAAPKPHRPS